MNRILAPVATANPVTTAQIAKEEVVDAYVLNL